MKVIAKVSRSLSNPALGYIKPVYKYDDQGSKYIEVNDEMFPNDGEIFIYGGFSTIVNQIQNDELFELSNINKNEVNYEVNNPKSCFYSASAASFRRLRSTEFIQIIETNFDYPSRIITDTDLSYYKLNDPFFIKSQEYLYGPFIYSDSELYPLEISYYEEDDYTLDENIEDLIHENKDCIFKYNIADVSELILDDFIADISQLLNKTPVEILYYGTKESIINWGKVLFKSKLSEQESQLLLKIKDINIPNLNNNIERQKLQRLFTYINETNTWLNLDIPKYLNDFFKSENGKAFIDKFLDDNQISFFNTYRKDEINEIENKVVDKQQELEGLKHQINDLEKRLETQDDKVFEGIDEGDKKALKTIIQDKELRIKVLEFFAENQRLDEITKEISHKEGERNYLQKDIDDLSKKQNIIEKAIQGVKAEFFEDSDFARKIMDAKIYTDLINNIDPRESDNENLKKNLETQQNLTINNKGYESPKNFVIEIQNRLGKINRNVSFNDVANYLISIHQNFFVIFAGLPGVGKTSLIEKLAKSLGCIDNKRFLKIAVSRGWTSSKDLIGYFNPLTKKYQSSKTGLLEALRLSEYDSKINNPIPNLILLDEANLSSIEHYWSDFLSLSDDEYTKEINITDTNIIHFGEGIRFLATINYDHTTEVLSNRLISRAPIIKLENNSYHQEMLESVQETMDIFPFDQWNTYLSPKSNKEYFKDDVKNKFDSIIKALEDENLVFGNPTIIGFRKYNAVEKYCKVAGLIMEDDNKFTALDYAVNQIILPLISGRGDNYNKRLNNMVEKLQGLPTSSAHLAKIIKVGDENFKNYSYFC